MRRAAGFTLLEVLLALAVFGLLMAGLDQGLRYGLRALQSQAGLTDRRLNLDAVDTALRHMIAVADPGDGAEAAPIAVGRDHLEFVTSLPDGAGAGEQRRVEAALLVDAAHRLVLRWRPWRHAERLGPVAAAQETELLAGVSALNVAVWQPRGGWVTEWRGVNLPALVRLRVVFPANDPRHWPDLVAAPGLDPP